MGVTRNLRHSFLSSFSERKKLRSREAHPSLLHQFSPLLLPVLLLFFPITRHLTTQPEFCLPDSLPSQELFFLKKKTLKYLNIFDNTEVIVFYSKVVKICSRNCNMGGFPKVSVFRNVCSFFFFQFIPNDFSFYIFIGV